MRLPEGKYPVKVEYETDNADVKAQPGRSRANAPNWPSGKKIGAQIRRRVALPHLRRRDRARHFSVCCIGLASEIS